MSTSLNLGKLFNIPIKIHWSFWLFIFWVGSIGYRRVGEWQGFVFAIIPLLLFFLCVIMHELGHALIAKLFGVEVKGITLWPFGGMAQIRNMPQQGTKELIIAVAGPLVNFLIALILGDILLFGWGSSLGAAFIEAPNATARSVMELVFSGGNVVSLLAFLVVTNFLLGIFNLIPAFPMDGGRILRSLLALVFPFNVATHIAARVGQGLAIVGILLTLTPHFGIQSPSVVLVAMFVLIGALYEDKVVQRQWVLNTLRVADVNFATTIPPVFPKQSLQGIMKQIFNSPQHDVPVVFEGKLVGMLRRDDLLLAMQGGRVNQTVDQVMRTDYPSVNLKDNLQTVRHYITSTRFATLPVLERGQLVGVINLYDINKAYTADK